MTHPDSISQAVKRAFNDLGTIDVLVNNAGYGLFGAVEEATDQQIEHLFQTNVLGALRVACQFLPHFRSQTYCPNLQ